VTDEQAILRLKQRITEAGGEDDDDAREELAMASHALRAIEDRTNLSFTLAEMLGNKSEATGHAIVDLAVAQRHMRGEP
jgi:hypothetical protein